MSIMSTSMHVAFIYTLVLPIHKFLHKRSQSDELVNVNDQLTCTGHSANLINSSFREKKKNEVKCAQNVVWIWFWSGVIPVP